ncbi:unnamed protein product [Schistocephalus solidus]|uniref:Uncharacterized protein n=1 Tax=Schistocephalus solidus TaxID=70667 RepID=A0A183SYX5_SCHSO|nr:unnamed protein product [Schistocephalus solidus]
MSGWSGDIDQSTVGLPMRSPIGQRYWRTVKAAGPAMLSKPVCVSLTPPPQSDVVNAPGAATNWYPTLTCGSSKRVLPSGHTPGNRHDQRAKPGEGLRCCVCLHTRYVSSLRPALPPLLFPAHSSLPSFFSSFPSSRLSFLLSYSSSPLLLLLPLPFFLSTHPSLLAHHRKHHTVRATYNHVGGPGKSVILSLTPIVTHSEFIGRLE